MKSYFLLIVAILSSAFLLNAQDNAHPFKSGEKLDFILNYTWGGVITDVGSATCVMTTSGENYNVLITGKTYKFYDMFFKVRERFESTFTTTLRPVKFNREAAEGKYRMKNTLTFKSDNSISSRTQKYDRTPVDTVLFGTANTMDLITLFYKSRSQSYSESAIGKKMPLEFVIDKEIYKLYFIYQGKENKKIPGLGTYRTMKFTAKVVAGNIFDGKEDMTIWVTDDKNKIPLMFESPILVGKVQGRLSSMSGMKYPVTSKLK